MIGSDIQQNTGGIRYEFNGKRSLRYGNSLMIHTWNHRTESFRCLRLSLTFDNSEYRQMVGCTTMALLGSMMKALL